MEEAPKKYKYEIPAEVFIEAFTATNEEFEEKKEYLGQYGIIREIGEKINRTLSNTHRESWYTIFEDSLILPNYSNKLDLAYLDKPLDAHLVISHCSLPDIIISTSQFGVKNKFQSPNLFLDNVDFKGFTISKNTIIGDFWITNSLQNGLFIIREGSMVGNFNISNKTRLGGFSISGNLNSGYATFFIGGKEERVSATWNLGNIKLDNYDSTHIGDFRISDNTHIGDFLIYSKAVTGHINISNKVRLGNLSIFGKAEIGNVYFENNIEVGNFYLAEYVKTGFLHFNQVSAKAISLENLTTSLKIEYCNIPELKILNSELNEFKIGEKCNVNITITDCRINYLKIVKMIFKKDSTLSMNNVSLFAFIIDEVDIHGQFTFRRIQSLYKPYRHLRNLTRFFLNDSIKRSLEELFKLQGVSKSTIRISYTSLGNTEFIDCDLNGFERFEFNNSRITEVFISGGSIPEENVYIHGSEADSADWFDQKISFFNQLSSVFQRQGDTYRAINYRSKSSKFQRKLLEKKLAERSSLFDSLFKFSGWVSNLKFTQWITNWFRRRADILELLPFVLNNLSNRHGENWGRALVFIITSSVALYMIIIATTESWSFHWSMNPAHVNWTLIGAYFDFINPVRPFDFYDNLVSNKHAFLPLLDLLSRVIIGYGIYQLIQAFRRYGRK